MIRRAATLLISLPMSIVWLGANLLAQTPPTQGGDTGWVPITQLPPGETLPAAPFLIAAYAIIWVGVLLYAWSIWKRLGKVEREMHALEQRRK
jgi:CcmD family protein